MTNTGASEVLQKMQRALAAVEKEPAAPEPKARITSADGVPPCDDGEFLVSFDHEDQAFIACCIEPTWVQAAKIEGNAYARKSGDVWMFNGIRERRLLMQESLRWIASEDGTVFRSNQDGLLLSHVTDEAGETIWDSLEPYLFVQLDEAKGLYATAKQYFSGEATSGLPVPIIVLEMAANMRGEMHFTAQEYRSILMSDFERREIIRMAYHEHCQPKNSTEVPLPPGVNAGFGGIPTIGQRDFMKPGHV